jgi:hypothetical protein
MKVQQVIGLNVIQTKRICPLRHDELILTSKSDLLVLSIDSLFSVL